MGSILNNENVYDKGNRLIPLNANALVYRYNNTYQLEQTTHVPKISLRDDILFVDMYSGQVKQNQLAKDVKTYQEKELASALGFNQSSSVFNYQSRMLTSKPNLLDIAGPLISNINTTTAAAACANYNTKPKSKQNQIGKLVAMSILQAPGLRNDFYSNLITWSTINNKIAIGLGTQIYLWGVDSAITRFDIINYEIVTCVSSSPKYDYLIIGTSSGTFLLLDEKSRQILAKIKIHNKSIYCITWFSNGITFLLGDEEGDIYAFEIQQSKFSLIKKFKCHHQQICGIVINHEENEIAVGGNDNCCTIWDITNIMEPKLKFKLKHEAAVKALAYCPWSKSLLATGGGSKDRNIRFWHTKTGTLLNKFCTNAQVTSVSWSKFHKEIIATFGFGNHNKILIVYCYPSMLPRLEIIGSTGLRILSSSLSPDSTSIAIAANDCTIRIYKIWKKTATIISAPEIHGVGTYGSTLIEHAEGIHHKAGTLR